jgi:aminoglycoside phosphotransferase family enzyme/adenylate kinase family enzyme
MPDISGLIAALSDPHIYPEPASSVKFIQTQMSCVFLTGEYAYKIKKPVNLGYVDYTTLEKRLYFCEQEIKLNRRLCPEAYLEVVPVTFDGGNYALSGRGEIVEYVVKMRRLPDDRLLDNLLRQNAVTPEMMERVARKLADFHKTAETNELIAAFGGIDIITQNTEENFSQTQKYFGRSISQKQFDAIKNYTRSFIEANKELFERRVKEKRTRDCHGDLHAQHICFCHDLCIFDCIEFNERFRYCDVASEAAFLAMDLDRSGRADLSLSFIDEYISQSGDKDISCLLDFYKCYRAYVRGKVASFKLDDPLVSEPDKADSLASAQGYFDLAAAYTRGNPLLIIMVGLVGSGKTTLSNALAQRLGAVHISSDITRKRLAGIQENEHRYDEPATGLYSPEYNRKTYDALFSQAEKMLKRNTSVILDAAFLKAEERKKAAGIAQELTTDYLAVECRLSPELTQKRLLQRLKEVSASDGSWDIYQKQLEWFEPVKEFPAERYMSIDTSLPLAQNIRQVLNRID